MSILTEDPGYLLVVLGALAGVFLIALRVTQQARYLFWALGVLGLAASLALVEHLWVTDGERIEQVVYDLRQAVLASDAEGVLKHLTSDVEYGGRGGARIRGEVTRELIRSNLANASFDFVHVNGLQTDAGSQTRRGNAEFHIYARGTLHLAHGSFNVGTANSTWSLGLEEAKDGTWKVNRITPISVPEGAIQIPDRYALLRGKSTAPTGR